MPNVRKGTDRLGVVEVPADKLWGAHTQRSLGLTVRRTAEK
jgi:fumarate hydratase class II